MEYYIVRRMEDKRWSYIVNSDIYIVNGLESIDCYFGLQFVSDSRTTAAMSNSKLLKREVFPSKACNDICHFVNVRDEFLLNRVTGHWNELTNSQVNAKNINSFKADLNSLPILAAKGNQAQYGTAYRSNILITITITKSQFNILLFDKCVFFLILKNKSLIKLFKLI